MPRRATATTKSSRATNRRWLRRVFPSSRRSWCRASRVNNATPAHEATEWAKAQQPGKEHDLRRAIFRAYFVFDRNIGSPDVLAELATDIGLDGNDLRQALSEGRYKAEIERQYLEAREVGVTGVPTFIAEDRYAVVGAQPYETFLRLMEAVGAEKKVLS